MNVRVVVTKFQPAGFTDIADFTIETLADTVINLGALVKAIDLPKYCYIITTIWDSQKETERVEKVILVSVNIPLPIVKQIIGLLDVEENKPLLVIDADSNKADPEMIMLKSTAYAFGYEIVESL